MRARHQVVENIYVIQRKGKNLFLANYGVRGDFSGATYTPGPPDRPIFSRLSSKTWTCIGTAPHGHSAYSAKFSKRVVSLMLAAVAQKTGLGDLVLAKVRLITVKELV